jgi:hypothetical protein
MKEAVVHHLVMYDQYLVHWGIDSFFFFIYRLCGLVVRVPGHRSRGPGFDCRRYQIF